MQQCQLNFNFRYRQAGAARYRQKREDIAAQHRWGEGDIRGKSPQVIDFNEYGGMKDRYHHKIWVSPRWNNEVFERDGVNKAFFLLILLVIIGEFFR